MKARDAFNALREALDGGTVPARSVEFVGSLCRAYGSARGWSDKQEMWALKLATEGFAPVRPVDSRDVYAADRAALPAPRHVRVEAAPVFALLRTAQAAGLAWPKVRQAIDGATFAVGLAGPRSKYYGSATVTGPTPDGADRAAWYGVISPDGVYSPARNTPPAVVEAVAALAADPAGRAALHGRLTGSCCFCGRRLDTRESVAVGYGPVCADKFGLPWGDVAGYATVRDAAVADAFAAATATFGAPSGPQEGPQDGEREAAGFGVGAFDVMGDAAAVGPQDGGRFRFEALPGVVLRVGTGPAVCRNGLTDGPAYVEPDEANDGLDDLPF